MSSIPVVSNRIAILRVYLMCKLTVDVCVHPIGQTRPAVQKVVHLSLELGCPLLGPILDSHVEHVGSLHCYQLLHNVLVLQAPQSF